MTAPIERLDHVTKERNIKMYVMAVSTISDNNEFWTSLKRAYGQLPKGAKWTLAVGSTDGHKAVNVLVHDSIDAVRNLFEEYTSNVGITECFEVDADNAVGLSKK
jgi:hypothetical protein